MLMRLLSVLILLCLAWPASAAGESGRAIAERAQQVLFGYEALSSSAKMTLFEGDRTKGHRSLEVRLLENDDPSQHDRGLITVTGPAVFRDTKLLSWSSGDGDEQQWLYMPRTERTRRIGDRGRKATFVNSDYTFEDLLKWQLGSYTYTAKGEAPCPAGTCKLVKAVPERSESNYAYLDVYYDDLYRISKIEYYRPGSDDVWKRQIIEDYVEVADSWQPGVSKMSNYESDTSTVINWSDYVANPELDRDIFWPNNL